MQPKTIQNWVFGGILVLLFLLVCRLFFPFFSVLLWSCLLYVLFSPLHHRVVRNIDPDTKKGKLLRSLWAGAFSIGTVVLILIPLSFVVFQFSKQIWELMNSAKTVFADGSEIFKNTLHTISEFIRNVSSGYIDISADEVQANIMSFLTGAIQQVMQWGTDVVRNVGSFFVNLVFMIFCLFFFYLDGAYLSKLLFHAIPIRKEYTDQLVGKFKDITRNLFMGYIMVGLIQAVVAYIIFLIFRVQGAFVFAILIIFFSFIPMLGPVVIWLPIGIFFIAQGHIGRGILFMAICTVTVSSLDNILRPLFLKDRVKLHPLIIFFAILGGVSAFGFNGLILGPMVVILFLTVLDLFLSEHKIREK
ncbi:AI-2E family transporter [Breznakiella homolactica]|uniref:AI-2E family transporter n=1 Tax=Breznakiella homolactica TaxID=2798577 RepID=A0A7T7XLI6_9SPIR|nr:AI-2E family transporter [Breznakiella homolactica]QQO08581.1 AI-2E family transporter [Breznakiella homolactica]